MRVNLLWKRHKADRVQADRARGVRMRARRFMIALSLALVAALAVWATLPTAAAEDDSTPDLDGLFLRVAQRLPQFGGAYFDEEDSELVHIWLTEPSRERAERALTVLAAVVGGHFRGQNVLAERARFSFAELKQWHDDMVEVLALPGVVLTDIDERRNVLLVGVEDVDEHGPAVVAELERRNVPREAVLIEDHTPIVPNSSLRNQHRPLVGGLQIQFASGPFGVLTPTCSLGFVARRSSIDGFVTASHCSSSQGQVDGGKYWQATRPFLNDNEVGFETVDPGFFTGGDCPSGRRCRFSDANFVRGTVSVNRGRIANTSGGSTDWSGATHRITSESLPAVNMGVVKVGRTTGKTAGIVRNTCIRGNVDGTNITLLCQHLASYNSEGGDSGSAVFRITNSPQTTDVALIGIHWGAGVDEPIAAFSDISRIQSEIGTVGNCASGFSC